MKMALDRREKNISLIVECLLFLLAVLAVFFRMQRGVDITDETWYVAEPYLVSQGQLIPYVDNWTQSPGFSIPLAFFFGLYTRFCGTDGIMFFARCLYLVWMAAVALSAAFVVRKNICRDLPLVWILPLLLTTASAFDISYNSIGLTYLPLVLVLLFASWEQTERKALLSGFFIGILGARMIIGTPQTMIPCFILLILLFILRKRHLAFGLMLGVSFAAVLVVGWCCLRGGVDRFLYGMRAWLTDSCYFKLESRHTLTGDLRYMLRFFIPAFVFFPAALLLRFLFRRDDAAYSLALAVLISCFILFGAYMSRYNAVVPYEFIRYTWFESFGLLFFKGKKKNRLFLILAVILYFTLYCFSSFSNVYGFGSREYWLIVPSVMTCLSLLLLKPWEKLCDLRFLFPAKKSADREAFFRSLVRACFILLMSAFFLLQCRCAYSAVYRDEAFSRLTTTVDAGIWKGCRTTASRADAIVELEDHIRHVTEKDDRVFFLDWASFAYLMNNGKACSSQSLDPCGYSYRCNEPRIIYDYFKQVGFVPNKIIYIDYGRDDQLSVEDPSWRFTGFVDSFYVHSSTFRNALFRVEEYTLTDEASALEYALANALP